MRLRRFQSAGNVRWAPDLVGLLVLSACGNGGSSASSIPDATASPPDAAAAISDAAMSSPDAGPGPDAATPSDAAASSDGSTLDAGRPTWDLENPGPGEWPMFKRRNSHDGLVLPSEMTGAMTASSMCLKWKKQMTVPLTRGAAGIVAGKVGGKMVLFQASETCPVTATSCTQGSVVYALDAATGAELWKTTLPNNSQSDPYAPLLADVDADGKRELVLASNNSPYVYALRTEDEGSGKPAGSIQWTFTFPDTGERSEGAPAAANFDPSDDALEIVLGNDTNGAPRPASVYVINGADGTLKSQFNGVGRRSLLDPDCAEVNKTDSSSLAIANIGGQPYAFVGSWDGAFYALRWGAAGIEQAWKADLPANSAYLCSVAKVRAGSAVGQIVPGGDPEVAFGVMWEGNPEFATAYTRILNAATGVLVGEYASRDWKSTPSIVDLDGKPGLEIVAGRYLGYGAITAPPSGTTWAKVFDVDYGDGLPYGANRSSPAVADIDGDGQLDIVVGTEGKVNPGLTVLDSKTGAVKWIYPVAVDPSGQSGVVNSPALVDVDGDGKLEVAFFAFDGALYVLDDTCR